MVTLIASGSQCFRITFSENRTKWQNVILKSMLLLPKGVTRSCEHSCDSLSIPEWKAAAHLPRLHLCERLRAQSRHHVAHLRVVPQRRQAPDRARGVPVRERAREARGGARAELLELQAPRAPARLRDLAEPRSVWSPDGRSCRSNRVRSETSGPAE